jgi:murein DD-endopeptidase MepM/ murein hydrolase activator NlpD
MDLWRRGRRARSLGVLLAAIGAALTATAGIAAAEGGKTGGTSTSGGDDGEALKLKAETAKPGKVFFYGKRRAVYNYEIGGDRPRNIKVQAVKRKNWNVVKVWRQENVEPGTAQKVQWSGKNKKGNPVRKGAYLFRVRTMRGADADRSRTKRTADRSFGVYPEKFPVRARHTYGDGVGAPRSGHTHQGQDVFADCGKRLVAARGGRVQYSGNQAGGAGYYLVIDGKSTGRDYVYIHLQRRGRAHQGERVRTGERIGRVGSTGNSSGCHLHFELWSKPGWYEGGHFMRSVTKRMKKWDRWS